MLVLSPPAVDMQALAETSLKMLKQLIEGRDTAACLEAGLQVVVQVQVQWPDGIGAASTSQPCCLQSFIQAKVKRAACFLRSLRCIGYMDELLCLFSILLFVCCKIAEGLHSMDAATTGAVQATSAETALAQCLAHWRTQDPSSCQGPTASTQVASHISPCCTKLKYALSKSLTIPCHQC